MLKVQTYLDRSAVHGTGLFAKQAIKRGTVVWRLDTRCDRVVSDAEYEVMPEPRFFNHSAQSPTSWSAILFQTWWRGDTSTSAKR